MCTVSVAHTAPDTLLGTRLRVASLILMLIHDRSPIRCRCARGRSRVPCRVRTRRSDPSAEHTTVPRVGDSRPISVSELAMHMSSRYEHGYEERTPLTASPCSPFPPRPPPRALPTYVGGARGAVGARSLVARIGRSSVQRTRIPLPIRARTPPCAPPSVRYKINKEGTGYAYDFAGYVAGAVPWAVRGVPYAVPRLRLKL